MWALPKRLEGEETLEGHVLRFEPGMHRIVGLTGINACPRLDRDARLTITNSSDVAQAIRTVRDGGGPAPETVLKSTRRRLGSTAIASRLIELYERILRGLPTRELGLSTQADPPEGGSRRVREDARSSPI